jgi:hypothetical protein
MFHEQYDPFASSPELSLFDKKPLEIILAEG